MNNKPVMRKIFNSIQVVLLIVALILILTSTYGTYSQYEYKWLIYGGDALKIVDANEYKYVEPLSTGTLYFSNVFGGNPFWGYVSLGIIGLCIIISLASIIRKSNDRDSILHFILPVLALPSYVFFAGLSLEFADCLDPDLFTITTVGTSLKTVVIILCAVIVIAFMKRSRLFNPKPIVTAEIVRKPVPVNAADELKKYKELLDSSVISQEEFDAKKKQLLEL